MIAKQASIRAWILPHLLAHAAGHGVDSGALRREAGLEGIDLDDPDARVGDAAAIQAWRLAVAMTGDAALGLHMAEAIPAGALDLLEYAFRTGPTLYVGLSRLSRYGRVLSDRAGAQLVHEEAGLAVTWDAGVQRCRVDFALAFVLRLSREAVGRPLAPLAVRLAYPAPPAGERVGYQAFFKAPISHDAPLNQLVFAHADLDRPLISADAALAGVVGRRLEKMLAELPPAADSAVAAVRRVLARHLVHGDASLDLVCRELGMSRRTLHRRLGEEGASFRHLLDDVRGGLARALLREPSIGIGEIAFLLGYSEPSAFHRSFRRWTGVTPRDYRQRGGEGG